jgi:hypothetical protein
VKAVGSALFAVENGRHALEKKFAPFFGKFKKFLVAFA